MVIIPQFKLGKKNLVPALSHRSQQGVGMWTQAFTWRDFTAGSAPKLVCPQHDTCYSTQGGTYTATCQFGLHPSALQRAPVPSIRNQQATC